MASSSEVVEDEAKVLVVVFFLLPQLDKNVTSMLIRINNSFYLLTYAHPIIIEIITPIIATMIATIESILDVTKFFNSRIFLK